MQLGPGCSDFIYILLKKKKVKKNGREKNTPAVNRDPHVIYEKEGWAGTIH